VNCLANARTCAAGEVPTFVLGECCRTCIPAPPVCLPSCAANYTCIGARTASLCVPTRRFHFLLAAFIRFAADAIRDLIGEIVQRFCERNENKDVCLRFGRNDEELRLILRAIVVTIVGDRMDIDIPSHQGAAGNKRQQGDFASLVGGALTDPTANGGYQFDAAPTDSTFASSTSPMTTATRSDATAITLSFFVALVMLLL